MKKQPSNESKKSKQNVVNQDDVAENDALSAKNGVLDNDSQEDVVNASPPQQQEEEQKAQVPQEDEIGLPEEQPDATALVQEMLDEEEEILPPEQLDESPSVHQNGTPLDDMQSLAGSIKQSVAPQNEMFGEEQNLEKALTTQNEPNDDFDQFFAENQQNIDTYTNFDKVDETKNSFEKITELSPTSG